MNNLTKSAILIFAVAASILTFFLPLQLNASAQIVLAIIVLSMVLWISEVIPLYVTSIIIAILLVIWAGFPIKDTFAPFFDPVVVLLFGGFVLALGMQKHKLDEVITYSILNRTGASPSKILFGIICLTAFISCWMTNTATTAIMLPIAIVVLKNNNLNPLHSNFGKALILGIAFAATIGGMATVVGSTPNVMAVKFLADHGIKLTFFDWMRFALPFVIIMIPILWFVLMKLFKPEIKTLKTELKSTKLNKQQKIVAAVFAVTVALWVTSAFTGISDSIIALVPLISFSVMGLLEAKDISKIEWDALLLFGGGLALGAAIHTAGLDVTILQMLQGIVTGQSQFIVLMVIIALGFIITTLVSNTAAAALLIPLVLPLGPLLGIDLRILAIAAALGVSTSFVLPISTPPNTIAYSSGYIKTKDMAIAGLAISIIGIIVLSAVAYFLW